MTNIKTNAELCHATIRGYSPLICRLPLGHEGKCALRTPAEQAALDARRAAKKTAASK